MASDLEKSGVSAGHVTQYISDLRTLAKAYEKVSRYPNIVNTSAKISSHQHALAVQTQRLLQGPRFPSYKPFGPTHSSTIEACPYNLHTSLMEVLSPSSSRPPPSPTPSDGILICANAIGGVEVFSFTADDSSSPVVGVDTTSYLISTMACPCIPHLLSVRTSPLPFSLFGPSLSLSLVLFSWLCFSICRRQTSVHWRSLSKDMT